MCVHFILYVGDNRVCTDLASFHARLFCRVITFCQKLLKIHNSKIIFSFIQKCRELKSVNLYCEIFNTVKGHRLLMVAHSALNKNHVAAHWLLPLLHPADDWLQTPYSANSNPIDL